MDNKKYNIENFTFKVIDCDDKTCQIKFQNEYGEAFSKERRKLYIILDGNTILYIGEANCSIKQRFRRACSSYNHYARTEEARGWYKGYKWLNKSLNTKRDLSATVAIFTAVYDAEEKRNFIEAIEGELVFLVRKKLGYWPKFQNEIHFQNRDGAEEIAIEIFKSITS